MTRNTDDEHEKCRLNFSRCETVMSLLKLLNASETFTSYLKYKRCLLSFRDCSVAYKISADIIPY